MRRHLRRLAIAHRYLNIDEDLDALDRVMALSPRRRTPVVELGVGGTPLVEPDNDTLTGALIELDMLTPEQARERMEVQNVGDLERVARAAGGVVLFAAASGLPRLVQSPFRILGAAMALSGASGWCPVYQFTGLTSLGGPGDRPDESLREAWIAPRRLIAPARAEGSA